MVEVVEGVVEMKNVVEVEVAEDVVDVVGIVGVVGVVEVVEGVAVGDKKTGAYVKWKCMQQYELRRVIKRISKI